MEDYGVARGYIELDTSSLESNVKSATKALDELERRGALVDSEMNKLQSQSLETGNAFQRAQERAKSLSSQIEQAQKHCGLYQEEIKALNTIIDQNKKKQSEWAGKIKDSETRLSQSEKKVESLSEAYKEAQKEIKAATKEYGENSDQVKELEAKYEKLIRSYEKAQQAVTKNRNTLTQQRNEQEAFGIEIEKSGNKITEFQTKLNNTQASINRMTTELAMAHSAAVQFGQYMQEAGGKLQSTGDMLNGWGNTLSLAVTAPLTAAGTYAVKTAIDFESAFTGVTKTVNATEKELSNLRQGIIDMSKEIPSSTTEISAVAEAAGQLGIQTKNILGFTRTMIDLGNSTNLAAEEGASALAQFANVARMSQDKFSNLGSTIVDLGNNFATTEADIVAMGSRLVGAGSQVGMTEPQILSFAAALSSVGIEAEAGGTAFSTLMSNMQLAVETGGESLNQFAEVSGMSAEQFQQAFRDDAAGAILAFVQGLATCEERGMSAISVLNQMGLSDVRMRDALLRAAGASDVFSQAIATGTAAWEENVALTNEAEKRYATTASQIEISKNRIADSARVIGEQIMPVMADVVGGIADLAEKFGDLDPEMQQTIIRSAAVAASLGPVLKVTGSAVKGVGSLAEGFGTLVEKAGRVKTVGKVAETVSNVGTEAVGTTSRLGGFTGVLSKIASPFGIAALATTAVIGIGAALVKAKKDAEKADLEEHFGDIKLSAEEIEDVAKRLTENGWTMRIDAVIDAKDKLDELKSGIQETIQIMNKNEWKVGIGLELTEEEQEEYRQSVTDYISGVQSYVEQQRYAVNLAIDAIFDPGSEVNANFRETSDTFYSSLSGELSALGTELAELSNQAWEDNFLSEEELGLIDEKRAEIQKKMDEIAQAEYDLELSNIQADATKDGLTADSFKQLQESLTEKLDEREAEIEDTKRELMVPYQVQYNNGDISLEEFNAKKKEVDLYAKQQFGNIVLDVVNIEADSIKNAYADEISSTMDDFYAKLQEDVTAAGEGVVSSWDEMNANFAKSIQYSSATLSEEARTNVTELLKNMEPQTERLEEIAQSYIDAGQMVPASISKGLMDVYQMEALTGNTEHMYELLAGQIAESPTYQEAVANAAENGMGIPEELASALESNYGLIYNATTGMFEQIQPDQEQVEAVKTALGETASQIPPSVINALALQSPNVRTEAISLLNEIQNGATLTAPQLQSVLSACGYSAGDSLASALEAKGPDVQLQAISLLNQLSTATGSQRETILSQLSGLGIEVGDSLSRGVSNSSGALQTAAYGAVDALGAATDTRIGYITGGFTSALAQMGRQGVTGMERVVSSSELDSPDVETPDWSSEAMSGRNGMQTVLDNNPLSVTVNMKQGSSSGIPGYAYGGIATEPSIFGEDGPEMAIPLSQEKRSRALALYAQTGELLGVTKQESVVRQAITDSFVASYRVENGMGGNDIVLTAPGIDYDLLASKVAEKMVGVLRSAPIQPIIEMQDGDVILENERVGRKVAPVISRIMAQNT